MTGGMNYESFAWAWSTVNTRSVFMEQPPSPFISCKEEDHYALAPLLDLLNHSTEAQVTITLPYNCP